MPFEFDPLSLDFPALTLRCLEPPPTLFSSTQYPTPVSWAVHPPGDRELNALRECFNRRFGACHATHIALAADDMGTVSEFSTNKPDNDGDGATESGQGSEMLVTTMERHLQSAYAAWVALPTQKRQDLWVLELAREAGRRQKDFDNLMKERNQMKQEIAGLRVQINKSNHAQQREESQLPASGTMPVDLDLIAQAYKHGAKDGLEVDLKDPCSGVNAMAANFIKKWDDVTKTVHMTAGAVASHKERQQIGQLADKCTNLSKSQSQVPSQKSPQAQQQWEEQQATRRKSGNTQQGEVSLTRSMSDTNEVDEPSAIVTGATGSLASGEAVSDQDADAETEDEACFSTLISPETQGQGRLQQSASHDIPRTHNFVHQQLTGSSMTFMTPSGVTGSVATPAMAICSGLSSVQMALADSQLQDGGMSMMNQVPGSTLYMSGGL